MDQDDTDKVIAEMRLWLASQVEVNKREYAEFLKRKFRRCCPELNRLWQLFAVATFSHTTLPAETVLCGLAGMFAAHAPPFSRIEVCHAA